MYLDVCTIIVGCPECIYFASSDLESIVYVQAVATPFVSVRGVTVAGVLDKVASPRIPPCGSSLHSAAFYPVSPPL